MLDQYFYPDEDQDGSSRQLHLTLEQVSYSVPDIDSGQAENKRDYPDDDDWFGDSNVQCGERDSHRQGIDAGSDGEDEQHKYVQRVFYTFIFPYLSGLVDHLAAYKTEQYKGDPVIDVLDKHPQAESRQPPDHGHDRLEKPEEKSNFQRMVNFQPFDGHSAGDGDGEGVHRQSYGNSNSCEKVHNRLILTAEPLSVKNTG